MLDEIFGFPGGYIIIREDREEVIDIEYEDITPPVEKKEIYEDLTGEDLGKP